MEVYILDSLLRRIQVVDSFQSLIWTERWTDLGDFELLITSTPGSRGLFIPGVQLTTNDSYRVMTVESVEDTTADDGKHILTVKGHSLETTLNDRVATQALVPSVNNVKWNVTGTPGDVARYMFDQICRNGVLDANDVIPFLQPGSLFAPGTIPEPATSITWAQDTDTLFNAVKAVCDQYALGFRLVRNFDTSQLYFDIYSGNDLTSSQSIFTPVVFAPNLDNLQKTTELTVIAGSKNVAYVFSSQGFQLVYDDGVAPDTHGFDRRVLLVKADDLPSSPNAPAAADITAHLIAAGQAELVKSRASTMFDGELNQKVGAYKYGTDYNLGDLVEMRNIDGIITKRRVTENITVQDGEGERSYPTLSAAVFVGGNTWLYQKTPVWLDYDSSTAAWADQV